MIRKLRGNLPSYAYNDMSNLKCVSVFYTTFLIDLYPRSLCSSEIKTKAEIFGKGFHCVNKSIVHPYIKGN